jgi:hypothetical protein
MRNETKMPMRPLVVVAALFCSSSNSSATGTGPSGRCDVALSQNCPAALSKTFASKDPAPCEAGVVTKAVQSL